MAIPENVASELRSKYEDINYFSISDGENEYEFLTRPPKPAEWKIYLSKILDPKSQVDALTQIIVFTLVWCTGAVSTDPKDVKAALDAILLKRPAFADKLANKIGEAAGSAAEIVSKKF